MALASRSASALVADASETRRFALTAKPPADEVTSKTGKQPLRILFLVSAHNGLSQRAWIALTELGHDVSVAVVGCGADMEAAVHEHDPQLVVCPFLKQMIPESIWARHRCLIVHPGPRGDRGPSSLDWAIELGERNWGVTVLQANGEPDAGDVWATRPFAMRGTGKSSLYRHEVRHAAIEALVEAIERIVACEAPRREGDSLSPTVIGRARPLMPQRVRAIDWDVDATDTVVRKIHGAEGHPGVLDVIDGTEFHLFGAHPDRALRGRAGEIIAQRTGAICRATVDGAVWITHLKRRDTAAERYFKLPATRALALADIDVDAPEIAAPLGSSVRANDTYREITYAENGAVGYLHFDFYNGAMGTDQCVRLLRAYMHARAQRHTRVIVLLGGHDYFSTGIHLNLIEADEDPAAESWRNLTAIDDLVRAIIETDSHLTISALSGDAGAGGVPLALAADYVVARQDVVLNPYYRHMGDLYGSEYWTYLLPRRVGAAATARITGAPFRPIGTVEAVRTGLIDSAFGADLDEFRARTVRLAETVAGDGLYRGRRQDKHRRRAIDERTKPLQAYRDEELARCHECFFGGDASYHQARQRFVYKLSQVDASKPTYLTKGRPMTLNIRALEMSFDLIAPRGEQLMDEFYTRLFETAPAVVPLFAAADLERQKAKLLRSLVLVRNSLRDLDAIVPTLRRLGVRHVAYGARPEHYPIVGETLIAAMATVAGPAWQPEHESAWREAFAVVAAAMLDGAKAAPATAAA
jgi:putative two-component system protein, hydrogenase maturation factor HypX/HoxX